MCARQWASRSGRRRGCAALFATNAKAQLGELAEALVGACDRSSHIARRKLTYETLASRLAALGQGNVARQHADDHGIDAADI
jgi:hypothetical protein